MIGPQADTAPRLGLPLLYFFTAMFFLSLASILILIEAAPLANGAYGLWQIKSLTHVLTLGFITMVVMGAAYQLVPVIMEVPIRSEGWATAQYYIYLAGVVLLTGGFWFQNVDALTYATLFLITSAVIFFLNILLTALKSKQTGLTARYLLTGLFYFLATSVIGSILAFNFKYGYLVSDHLLRVHVNVAMLGFILMTLVGVSLKLIPMFALSHSTVDKPARYLYWILNLAVILIYTGYAVSVGAVVTAGIVLAFISMLLYFYQMYITHSTRKRKGIDIGIRHSVSGVVNLAIAMILAVISLVSYGMNSNLLMAYVFYALFGFVAIFIVGQLHKILPFLVWFAKYSDKVGLEPVPNMQDMVDKRTGEISFWSLNIGIIFCGLGIVISQPGLLRAGAVALFIGSIAFATNMIFVTRR